MVFVMVGPEVCYQSVSHKGGSGEIQMLRHIRDIFVRACVCVIYSPTV